MPCYCDTPDEDDQIEIEKRAKTRMYFDALETLTEDQVKNNFICSTPSPDPNTALCNICKILTEEQMKKVSAWQFQIEWKHKTLHDWYLKHLEDDKENENS